MFDHYYFCDPRNREIIYEVKILREYTKKEGIEKNKVYRYIDGYKIECRLDFGGSKKFTRIHWDTLEMFLCGFMITKSGPNQGDLVEKNPKTQKKEKEDLRFFQSNKKFENARSALSYIRRVLQVTKDEQKEGIFIRTKDRKSDFTYWNLPSECERTEKDTNWTVELTEDEYDRIKNNKKRKTIFARRAFLFSGSIISILLIWILISYENGKTKPQVKTQKEEKQASGLQNGITETLNERKPLKILVLELEKLEDSQLKEVHIGKIIAKRLEMYSIEIGLGFIVDYRPNVKASTPDEAYELLEEHSSDIIIWGDFFERSHTSTKPSYVSLKWIEHRTNLLSLQMFINYQNGTSPFKSLHTLQTEVVDPKTFLVTSEYSNPIEDFILYLIGKQFLINEQPDKALEWLMKIKTPHNEEVVLYLAGLSSIMIKDRSYAFSIFSKLKEKDQNNPLYLFHLADLIISKNPEKAMDYLKKAEINLKAMTNTHKKRLQNQITNAKRILYFWSGQFNNANQEYQILISSPFSNDSIQKNTNEINTIFKNAWLTKDDSELCHIWLEPQNYFSTNSETILFYCYIHHLIDPTYEFTEPIHYIFWANKETLDHLFNHWVEEFNLDK